MTSSAYLIPLPPYGRRAEAADLRRRKPEEVLIGGPQGDPVLPLHLGLHAGGERKADRMGKPEAELQ